MSVYRLLQIFFGALIVISVILLGIQLFAQPAPAAVESVEPIVVTQIATQTPSPTATAVSADTDSTPEEEAPTATSTAVSPPITHTVAPGDTLFSLAQRYGVTVEALIDINNITNTNAITPGTRLIIPGNEPTPDSVAATIASLSATVTAVAARTDAIATQETSVNATHTASINQLNSTVSAVSATVETLASQETAAASGDTQADDTTPKTGWLTAISIIGEAIAGAAPAFTFLDSVVGFVGTTYAKNRKSKKDPVSPLDQQKEQYNVALLELEVGQKTVELERAKHELNMLKREQSQEENNEF